MKDQIKQSALNILVADILALMLTLFFGTYNGLLSLLSVLLVTTVFSIGINYLRDKYDARLIERMKADQPVMWGVWMNSVQVGTVSDSQYAAMQRVAFHDGRLSVVQFFNIGRVVLVVLEKLFIAVPLMFFWVAVALAMFSPETYMDMVHEFQNGDPATITSAVRSIFHLVLTTMILAVGGMVMMGCRFGFRNHYSEAVNSMLRQHCNMPAEGDVLLYRTIPGDVVAHS